MKSKTQQALEWMTANKASAYAAAKHFGINASAVSRALKRREGKETCPHCGQIIKQQGEHHD